MPRNSLARNIPKMTTVVARELGITYARLCSLLRTGRLAPPEKNTAGDYLWFDEDVQRARAALRFLERQENKEKADAHAKRATLEAMQKRANDFPRLPKTGA